MRQVVACSDCGAEFSANRGRSNARCRRCDRRVRSKSRNRALVAAREFRCKGCGVAWCEVPGPKRGRKRVRCADCNGERPRVCTDCGVEFVPGYGRWQRRCCDACGPLHGARVSEARGGRHPRVCQNSACGKTFKPKRGGRITCCSRECGWALERVRASAHKAERAEVVATLAALLPPVERARCDECGGRPVRRVGALCSDTCRRKRAGRKAREYAARKIEARNVWRGQCAYCGGEFWKKKHRGSKFCGKRCTKASSKSMRSARLRGGRPVEWRDSISLRRLIARDKGQCHLCGEAVRTDLGLLHDKAPTRDHIVPVSLGGEHSWANIKLAHRICNSRRGNRAA